MKTIVMSIALLAASASCWASTQTGVLLDKQEKENSLENVVYLERLPSASSLGTTAVGLRAGKMTFNDLEFRNEYSVFSYSGGEVPSLGLSFEAHPVKYLGSWGAYFDASYAFYKGNVASRDAKNTGRSYVSLLPISVGAVYVAEFHPVMRWFAPSFSVGAAYNVFLQGGDLDQFHARGGTWTMKRSLGVRHNLSWIGLKSTQLMGDFVINSPLRGSSEDSGRFVSRTFSLGVISAL